jgi:hypothetical protein
MVSRESAVWLVTVQQLARREAVGEVYRPVVFFEVALEDSVVGAVGLVTV